MEQLLDDCKKDYLICKDVTLIQNFFSEKECLAFISLLNESSCVRLTNRFRKIFESDELAEKMWNRLVDIMPYSHIHDDYGNVWQATGLNKCFRLIKYNENDEFSLHEDGYYQESYCRRSFTTAMVYLNTVPIENGGATFFPGFNLRIQPQEGLGCIFIVDNLLHCGEKIFKGCKYLLRTDVMYECDSLSCPDLHKQLFDLKQQAEKSNDEKIWTQIFDIEHKLKTNKTS